MEEEEERERETDKPRRKAEVTEVYVNSENIGRFTLL